MSSLIYFVFIESCVVIQLALIDQWVTTRLGSTVCWNHLLMRCKSHTTIVCTRKGMFHLARVCSKWTNRLMYGWLLPGGHLYSWTCVSWAQLCISFEATSFFLVSLGAGSSTDFFSIPWWFCCIACQSINQSIQSLLSTTAMTGLLSVISSGQISDASTSFRV